MGLLRKLFNLSPRQALVTIYKAFVRPHLDYDDVLYDHMLLIILSTQKWNPFNIMPVYQSQEPFEVRQVKKSTKNLA